MTCRGLDVGRDVIVSKVVDTWHRRWRAAGCLWRSPSRWCRSDKRQGYAHPGGDERERDRGPTARPARGRRVVAKLAHRRPLSRSEAEGWQHHRQDQVRVSCNSGTKGSPQDRDQRWSAPPAAGSRCARKAESAPQRRRARRDESEPVHAHAPPVLVVPCRFRSIWWPSAAKAVRSAESKGCAAAVARSRSSWSSTTDLWSGRTR